MGNYAEKKEAREKAKAEAEAAGEYKLNYDWLIEQEAANLGGKKLQRAGEVGCYSCNGYGKNKYGEPSGLPEGPVHCFSNPDFQRSLKNCYHHKAAYPAWDWDCKKQQDLSAPLATDEQIQTCMDNIRVHIARAKSKEYSKKEAKVYYSDSKV